METRHQMTTAGNQTQHRTTEHERKQHNTQQSTTATGQPCGPPPCSWLTWSVRGPTRWARSSSATVVEESIRIWFAHAKARATLLKARLGPGSTMAWALQELRLHQQAEREGVQQELLE